MPDTIKYLERLYDTTVVPVDRSRRWAVDFMVTLGRDAPDREVEAVG